MEWRDWEDWGRISLVVQISETPRSDHNTPPPKKKRNLNHIQCLTGLWPTGLGKDYLLTQRFLVAYETKQNFVSRRGQGVGCAEPVFQWISWPSVKSVLIAEGHVAYYCSFECTLP